METVRAVSVLAGILLALSPFYASPACAANVSGGNPFANVQAVSAANLEDARAKGIDVQAQLEGSNSSSTNISGDYTPTNSIDTGSFVGASGAFTVLQNTGSGAVLQNVTQVTVNFH